MITQEILFNYNKNGAWNALQLTPGETETLRAHLDQILVPVVGDVLRLPTDFEFLDHNCYYHSFIFPEESWDATNGWVS